MCQSVAEQHGVSAELLEAGSAVVAPAAAKEMEVDVRGGNRRASAKKEPAPEEPPAEDRTTKGKKGKKEKKEKKEKEPKPEKEKKSGGFFSKKKK